MRRRTRSCSRSGFASSSASTPRRSRRTEEHGSSRVSNPSPSPSPKPKSRARARARARARDSAVNAAPSYSVRTPMKRILALLACALLLAASPAKLTERQRALHALNRLRFGPRPGDVDRVMKIGVDTWIDQQLHPERIADTAIAPRLQGYATLQMS